MKRPIRGFMASIDTGNHKPISCTPPRYGPHEARVMTKLVEALEANGLIEDDDGPWGALIVLAGKPHQEHKHWTEYVWRLCVSYRKLNTVTRPFVFLSQRCDDAVEEIGGAKYIIIMDLAWGYWQVLLHEGSKAKTGFFVPNGKKRWTRMPMGALNSHATFCALTEKLKKKWNVQFKFLKKTEKVDSTGAKIIVDDILLYAVTLSNLIGYFREVLQVLREHRVTVNLKKCRFCPEVAEFVGIDLRPEGNAPARSKFPGMMKLIEHPPQTATDVLGLIGFFGFYQEWIPYYEVRIRRWREYKKEAPPPNASRQEQVAFLSSKWTTQDQQLLRELADELLKTPIRKRPDFERRFYLKTDWSKCGMGAALLQADADNEVARLAEEAEKKGGPCAFDKTTSNQDLRLRPITMLSRSCTKSERSYHSHMGELATGLWAMEKFKRYLLMTTFTWITDCSAIREIVEDVGDRYRSHQIQRWKIRLLQYDFVTVHRPARMLTEVDTLSRYETITQRLKRMEEEMDKPETAQTMFAHLQVDQELTTQAARATMAIPTETLTNVTTKITQGTVGRPTLMAVKASLDRIAWEVNPTFASNEKGGDLSGIDIRMEQRIETRSAWNEYANDVDRGLMMPYVSKHTRDFKTTDAGYVDWIICDVDELWTYKDTNDLVDLTLEGMENGLRAVIVFTTTGFGKMKNIHSEMEAQTPKDWSWVMFKIAAHEYGSPLEAEVVASVFSQHAETLKTMKPEKRPICKLREVMEATRETPRTEFHEGELQEDAIVAGYPTNPLLTLPEETQIRDGCKTISGNRAVPICSARRPDDIPSAKNEEWCPIFSTEAPGPALRRIDETNWMGNPFAIIEGNDVFQGIIGVPVGDALHFSGVATEKIEAVAKGHPDDIMLGCKGCVPAHARATIFEMIKEVEDAVAPTSEEAEQYKKPILEGLTKNDYQALLAMRPVELNTTTTLPLPTAEEWMTATDLDPDLQKVKKILETKAETIPMTGWHDRGYIAELKGKRLELEDGVLFRYEASARKSLRQVRAKVVPTALREVIIAACHASPFAGHTDENKTIWKMVSKFWWPAVIRDTRKAVRSCGMCKVSNAVSHAAKQKLKTVSARSPFDVISLDVWRPGRIFNKGNGMPPCKAILSFMDAMTSFASAGEIFNVDSHEVARALVTRFIPTFGMPRLILIDDGSENKDILMKTCNVLMIKYHLVTKGNHKAIQVERFHRFLNKVEQIHTAECATMDDWLKGVAFATYAWNAAPVDGTDVVRSYAATGREFPFPVEIAAEATTPTNSNSSGHEVLKYVEGAFPLLFKQQEVLRILNEDRRQHHRDLKNKLLAGSHNFEVGDLCIVQVQQQSDQEKGPAKLRIKARGPYRVLEKLSENTYWIQRLPFSQDASGGPYKPYKESAARMTLLPSTLVIHMHVDGPDSRFATADNPYSVAPLQHVLGAPMFGAFKKANNSAKYAFDNIKSLWDETILPANEEDEVSVTEDEAIQLPETPTTPKQPIKAPKQVTFDEDTDFQDKPRPTRKRRREPDGESTIAPEWQQLVEQGKTASPRLTAPKKKLSNWVKDLKKSADKLLFIEYQFKGTATPKWYLVIADVHEGHDYDAINETGELDVTFLIRHVKDSASLTQRCCRYWPQVNEYNKKTGTYGKIVPMRPDRAKKHINAANGKLILYQDRIQVPRDVLHGPFDFSRDGQSGKNLYRVRDKEWDAMTKVARARDIETSDVDKITPLR